MRTPTTEIYSLSLHDALPICELVPVSLELAFEDVRTTPDPDRIDITGPTGRHLVTAVITPSDLADRKSTRLNSSHEWISYAVFCLKKKKTATESITRTATIKV